MSLIQTDLPDFCLSASIKGNLLVNNDRAVVVASSQGAKGLALWQLSSTMHMLQGPSAGLIFAPGTSVATALHTQTCWLPASGELAGKDFSDRLSANDSHRDGRWEKEDTGCHFDSCKNSSNRWLLANVSTVVMPPPTPPPPNDI